MLKIFQGKSEFSRNVLTLMTGATIAQAIPIAITPFLTRIYTPEDFGILALFLAITAVLGSIASGRYELAIMLPEREEDALNIAVLGSIISFVFSTVIFIVIIFFKHQIASLLGNKELDKWLYFIPLVVLMMGLFNVLNYLSTRKKFYKSIANSNIYKSLGMSSTQLSVGLLKPGAFGLIIGQIFSHVLSVFFLAKNIKKEYKFDIVQRKRILKLAKRYQNFPKFSMWAILANSLSYNLLTILISSFYGVATLGFYSMVQKILGMPSLLIGNSIGQVYFQEAILEKKETGVAIKSFMAAAVKLFSIAFFLFAPLYFSLPAIFEVVFGERWRVSGEYGQVIVPFIAVRFIAVALSNTNNIFEKQKLAFFWQVGLLFLSLAIMFLSYLLDVDFMMFLKMYGFSMLLYYAFLCFILWRVSGGRV